MTAKTARRSLLNMIVRYGKVCREYTKKMTRIKVDLGILSRRGVRLGPDDVCTSWHQRKETYQTAR